MMEYTILIVDDEEDARELLKVHLNRHSNLKLVAEASNGHEALEMIATFQPDIILLDIQMPELNGIEVVERAQSSSTFVFVTAYDEFAVKAFELNAMDYLLKPISNDRFDLTIQRVMAHLQSSDGGAYKELVESVASTLSQHSGNLQRFTCKVGSKTMYIPVTDVILISSADQYVEIHTSEKKYLLRLSMDYLDQALDPAIFFRTHRSFIVKLDCVTSLEQYEPRNYLVHLKDNLSAKLTRDKKDELNRLLIGR